MAINEDLERASIIVARKKDGSYVIQVSEYHGEDGEGIGGSWLIEGVRFSGIGPIISDPENAVHQLWIRWTNT